MKKLIKGSDTEYKIRQLTLLFSMGPLGAEKFGEGLLIQISFDHTVQWGWLDKTIAR